MTVRDSPGAVVIGNYETHWGTICLAGLARIGSFLKKQCEKLPQ